MGNFRDNRSNDRRGGGGYRNRDQGRGGFNRGGGDYDRPSMHKAVCDECKSDCEVPFRPSSGKPIFCSECFSKQGGGSRQNNSGDNRSSRPRFEDRGAGKPNPESKEILKAIKTLNYKIEQLTKVLAPELLEGAEVKKSDSNKTEEVKEEKVAKKAVKKTAVKKVAKKAVKKTTAKKVVKKVAKKAVKKTAKKK